MTAGRGRREPGPSVLRPLEGGVRRSAISGRPLAPDDLVVCHHSGQLLAREEAVPGTDTLEFLPPAQRTASLRLGLGRGAPASATASSGEPHQSGDPHAARDADRPEAEAIPNGMHHPDFVHDARIPLGSIMAGAGLLVLAGAASQVAATGLGRDGGAGLGDGLRAVLAVADAATPGLVGFGLACLAGAGIRLARGQWREKSVSTTPPFAPATVQVVMAEHIDLSFDFDAGAATPQVLKHALDVRFRAKPDRLVARGLTAWFGTGTDAVARADAATWNAGFFVIDRPPPGGVGSQWFTRAGAAMPLEVFPPPRLVAGPADAESARPSVDRFDGTVPVVIGRELKSQLPCGPVVSPPAGDAAAAAAPRAPVSVTMSRDPDDPLTIAFTVRMSGLADAARRPGIRPWTSGEFRVDIDGARVRDVSDAGQRSVLGGGGARVVWNLPGDVGDVGWTRTVTLAPPAMPTSAAATSNPARTASKETSSTRPGSKRPAPTVAATVHGRVKLKTKGGLTGEWGNGPHDVLLVRPDGRPRLGPGEVTFERSADVTATIRAQLPSLAAAAPPAAVREFGPRGSMPAAVAARIERAVEQSMGADAPASTQHWAALADRAVITRAKRSSDPRAIRQVDLQFRLYDRQILSAPADVLVMVSDAGASAPQALVTVDPRLRRGALHPSPDLQKSLAALIRCIGEAVEADPSGEPIRVQAGRSRQDLEQAVVQLIGDPEERRRAIEELAAVLDPLLDRPEKSS